MAPRVKAFLLHLAISVAIIAAVLMLVFVFWYPAPFFDYEGAWGPLRILISVDLILGPLLTLLVFKPGKRWLWLDMAFIFLLQISALLYGAYALWSQRPLVMAFAVDGFYVVNPKDLAERELPGWLISERSWRGPAPVFAELVDDPDYLLKVMLDGAPDIQALPGQYRRLEEKVPLMAPRAYDLQALAALHPEVAQAIAGLDPGVLAESMALPVYGMLKTGTVLADRETGRPRYYLDLDLPALLPEQ
ncbi:hypothetical protein [Alcanivorax sp. 1008]|uniref:hypothetical protein n=1 Tax=Alcanivorax sp. 1008 TaxID=2816853 RepID=UPI001DA72E7C|nr:hypothetical protein [Alcanivorax sp. 1008]MCC1495312.1 hypothetical protein [Alcanivorax sp. 1008]